ncbi:Metallo-dependent phosphatase [Nemania sp. NC0429]|nr:Metallo-dependent phosphatase [Nemania sp. NC0429]
MAGESPRRPRSPRTRLLVLATIAFVLSVVFLTCTRLSPIPLPLNLSPRPVPNNNQDKTDVMAAATGKHAKGSAKKKTYPHISTLPAPLLPTDPSSPRRLIIIGDVHGHLKSLEALLDKAQFSPSRGDTVILAGDLVNKGPDSAGVVALAMRIGAFGVRGNHEDRVLSAWEHYESKRRKAGKGVGIDSDSDGDGDGDEGKEEDHDDGRDEVENVIGENGNGTADTFLHSEDLDEESDAAESSDAGGEPADDEDDNANLTNHDKEEKKGKDKGKKKKKGKGKGKKKSKDRKPRDSDLETAKSLSPEHRAWLNSLPLILRIGDLGPRYGEVVVVHAGLVPGIPLESQDPDAVMTMRTLLPSSDTAPASDFLMDLQHEPDADADASTQEPLPTAQTHKREEPEIPTPEAKTKNKNKNKHKNKDPHRPMIPSASREGIPWAQIWTSYQTSVVSASPGQARPATVVYGHDAKAGLRMRRYAFGLDSGCGQDNALTGVVFELAPAAHRGHVAGTGNATEDQNQNREEEKEVEEEEEQVEDEEGIEDENEEKEGEEQWDVDIARKEKRRKTRIRHRLVSVSCAEVR